MFLNMASRKSSAKSRPGSSRPSMEYYMRPESRMSDIPKLKPDEGERKAQFAWRIIRQCVREAVDLSLKADIKQVVVNHGVHHSKTLMHIDPIQQMVLNKTTHEYITLDGKRIRVYHSDGRKKEIVTPENSFNRLIHAYTQHLYVGWSYGNDNLTLMDNEFNVLSQSQSQGPILAAVFNENIHEVVTVGPGYLTSWVFRYGGRHLLPRKTIDEGLTEKHKLHLVVLEETLSRSQKAFAACDASVAVFNVHEGKFIELRNELHTRNITSLLFFNPLKYLITGAKDGTIKVWNSQWNLQLVFVGHSGSVTSLCVYPYGPSIMSASLDNTIRVWSLETCDEVDLCKTQDPVHYLGAAVSHPYFYSIATNHADIWKVENVHTFHTRIGHRVNYLKTTDHPEYPTRNLLLCKDASVRIVSPKTGDVLTTLLMPPKRLLVDATYAIAQEKIYACFNNGDIVVGDTTTNPCQVVDEWKCTNPDKACNYLLMYEYVITADVGTDMWKSIKRMATTKQGKLESSSLDSDSVRSTPRPPRTPAPPVLPSSANRTLLLGGRRDGHICVFNMQTGDVEFEIEAHGSKGVLSMIANSQADQLISSGLDNLIKIWRLFPYAQESLTPLMTLYCAYTPVFMCMLKSKLSVAFHDHMSATYSIVMYNLKNRNRQDHSAEEDHTDTVTGIAGCPKLKLLASCSHDGTIKIWNEMNNLVRLIRLNAVPHSLTFCNEKGDMLVGIGDHVHKIDYKTYMPKSYRFKMISVSFNELTEEKPIPYDDNLVNRLCKEDQRRLKGARASFKFTHFVDILTEDETEEVMRERNMKIEAFNALAAREEELLKIKNGLIQSKKVKLKPTKARKREAFDRYLKEFYNRPKLNVYRDEDYDLQDRVKEIVEGPKPTEKELWAPEHEPTGFFPSRAPTNIDREPTKVTRAATDMTLPATPIRGDGHIPNSVLVKLLFPKDTSQDEVEKKAEWRPPTLTDEQLMQINSEDRQVLHTHTSDAAVAGMSGIAVDEKKLGKDGTERILVLDWEDSDDERKTVTPRDLSGRDETDDDLTPKLPSALLLKAQQLMETEAELKVEHSVSAPTPEDLTVDGGDASKDIASSVTGGDMSSNTGAQRKPTKQVVKKVSVFKPAPPPPPPTTSVRAPPNPRSHKTAASSPKASPRDSSPPRPQTPLPDFISQFIGQEWFDKYFPNANANTFPKPWTVTAFLTMLVRILRIAEYHHKVDIMDAILLIFMNEGISITDPIYNVLYSILHHHTHPPSCVVPIEKLFIRKAIEILQLLGTHDRDFVVELMTQFIDGDKDIRNQVFEALHVAGLKDQHNYFKKELDQWDVWNLDDSDRQGELRRMCTEWLERWMNSFKIHLQDTIDRLKKGQTVQGRATPATVASSRSSPAPQSSQKGRMKRPSLPGLAEEGESAAAFTESSRVATLTFDKVPELADLENATYIDAINYFADMQLDKELQQIRTGGRIIGSGGEDKNTVLVLPKIPGKATLVRLGETHTSKCRPHRETEWCTDLRLPPITDRGYQPLPGQLYGFPNCLSLPLKQVIMNPFPRTQDWFDPNYALQQPVLLMLRTSQKYFVQERSVVVPDVIY